MVHMPAHIYIRVGRYNDAAASNVHAIHTDETFIEGQKPVTVYSLAYYPHNIHFLAFASTMAGRSAQALEAARTLKSKVNMDVAARCRCCRRWFPTTCSRSRRLGGGTTCWPSRSRRLTSACRSRWRTTRVASLMPPRDSWPRRRRRSTR